MCLQFVDTDTHTRAHTRTHMHTLAHTLAHTHTPAHAHTHTHTHTHTHNQVEYIINIPCSAAETFPSLPLSTPRFTDSLPQPAGTS